MPALAVPPFAATAHMGRLTGDARDAAAATGARTVPPREHGGNCDIKDLSRGSKIYFPVYVEGGGLSMGDLHFSQGDGEITFCGAIEMAGWVHLKVEVLKGRHGEVRDQEPHLQALAGDAELQGLSDLRGHLGRRGRRQHYLDVHIAYRQACLKRHRVPQEVRLFRRPAYSILGTAPVQGHISGVVDIPNACATLWLPTEIFDFDINPTAAGPTKFLDGSIDMPLSPDL